MTAPNWRRTFAGRGVHNRLVHRGMMCTRAVIVFVAVLWLALTPPTGKAMDDPLKDAKLIVHGQPAEPEAELSAQSLRTAPAVSTPGAKESDPLSVIAPLVLLVVWVGVGFMMLRRGRRGRSTRRR